MAFAVCPLTPRVYASKTIAINHTITPNMGDATRQTTATTPGVQQATRVPSESWRMLSHRQRSGRKLPKGLDAWWDAAIGRVKLMMPQRRMAMARAARIVAASDKLRDLSDARLKQRIEDTRDRFRLGRDRRRDLDDAFTLVREAADRSLGLRPHQVQVAGAIAMYGGRIAEMATGEGKTLTAALLATVASWRGRGCHVITVNDYLAGRDAEEMSPLFRYCGLRAAAVTGEMEPPARREAYLNDITYTTNKEVAADFLRDRLTLGRTRRLTPALMTAIINGRGAGADGMVMRGMDTAIIDEADSVLIDEAVTPLIISGQGDNEEQVRCFAEAAELAKQLSEGADYRINRKYREIDLTKAGKRRLADASHELGGVWHGQRRGEELLVQAIMVKELYTLDKQYVIDDGKIVIVDESTGRLMPDRTWRNGMHQAVEAKEGVEINPPKDTLARVSFQRFFRLYRKLCGMTGTGWEARHELWQIYHLPTVVIPTNKPCIRKHEKDRVFATREAKWEAVVQHIEEVHKTGRPVLVGTTTVEESEALSELLTKKLLKHQVLNAIRHEEEAAIVKHAGLMHKITVATNMAGRGTDIKLGRGVHELGGLYVIATNRHASDRIDRQLFGRAGRQGDPGTAIAFASLEDDVTDRYGGRRAKAMRKRNGKRKKPLMGNAGYRLIRKSQRRADALSFQQRKGVLKTDDWLQEFLGFAGAED